MNKKKKIGFFIGGDLPTHLVLNKIIPYLTERGLKPILYFVGTPKHFFNPILNLEPYKSAAFYEKVILKEKIYPFLGSNDCPEDVKNYDIKNLSHRYRAEVYEDVFVNSESFINTIQKDDSLIGGISIRCYQKFGPGIINVFENSNKFLWNMHPGKVPDYRGLLPPIRAMANNEKDLYWTLHEIDNFYDTGPIIDVRNCKADYQKSILSNYLNLVPIAVAMLKEAIESVLNGTYPNTIIQDSKSGAYYTFPDPDYLLGLEKEKRIYLTEHPVVMAELYNQLFSAPGTSHSAKLRNLVIQAIADWERGKFLQGDTAGDLLDKSKKSAA